MPVVVQASAARSHLIQLSGISMATGVVQWGHTLFCSASSLFVDFCDGWNERTTCFLGILFSAMKNGGRYSCHASNFLQGPCHVQNISLRVFFTLLERSLVASRPASFKPSSTSWTNENLIKIHEAKLENHHRTNDERVDTTGVSWSFCQRILRGGLQMKRITAKFVHYLLTEGHKQLALTAYRGLNGTGPFFEDRHWWRKLVLRNM